MIQKIIQVGNSLAITIPSAFVKEAKLRAGHNLTVDQQGASLLLTPQSEDSSAVDDSLTPEFLEWMKKFNAKYKKGLTELSNK